MSDRERTTAATCGTCGRHLTSEEFRACAGVGHYCTDHLPSSIHSDARVSRAAPRRSPRSARSRRGRHVSEPGVVEYSCKAQFAANGVIRTGWLTSDHPSCLEGQVVFVWKEVGYGSGEVVTLFIKDSEGRALAERTGYECHE